MKKALIQKLHASFEDCAHRSDDGVEFWLARELQTLLGYAQWRRFEEVIERAKTCSIRTRGFRTTSSCTSCCTCATPPTGACSRR